MQTINLPSNKSAADATVPLPSQPPTQQHGSPAAGAAPPAPPLTPPKTSVDPELAEIADKLAAQVQQCQSNALGWQIEAANRMRDYQEQLPPEDWAQVLESRRLRAGSPRKVQMLVRIARQRAFQDSRRLAQLPQRITVLNELAGLPAPVVEQALKDGAINREMTLEQAKLFVRECRRQRVCQTTAPQPV